MTKKSFPKRGDIVWFNFSPQAGHEQAGKRPALVLSEQPFQKATGLALICPITSRVRGHGFEVPLTKNMKTQGVVLCQQVRTLDLEERLGRFIEKASDSVLERALHIIRILVS